jgi:hypothetical protein
MNCHGHHIVALLLAPASVFTYPAERRADDRDAALLMAIIPLYKL